MQDTEQESFVDVLKELQSPEGRDPRARRLAAVTLALLEVVDDASSPAKVFAACVTTLEGTFQQDQPQLEESLSTQLALLELLCRTIPHVAAATVYATLSVTSRVLRGLVASCLTIATAMETKDELGGVNAVLRACCRAATCVLQQVQNLPENKTRKSLLQGTLLNLFQDRRPKVRKAAYKGVCELLSAGTDNSLQSHVWSYVHAQFQAKDASDLLYVLEFLELAAPHLNVTKLGSDLMERCMALLKPPPTTSQDFAMVQRQTMAPRLGTILGILTVVQVLLEQDENKEAVDAFATRVLASLIQARPFWIFDHRTGGDIVQRGRCLYGQVVLVACQRVLSSNVPATTKTGCQLLPVTIQLLVQLSKPLEIDDDDATVAQALFAELTKLFRSCGRILREVKLDESLRALKPIMDLSYQPTWSVSLKSLAVLLQLAQEDAAKDYVCSLLRLRTATEETSAQQAVEDAVASVLQGVGVETFWEWIEMESQTPVQLAWILPLVKSASTAALSERPRLAFFQQRVLDLARTCDGLSVRKPQQASLYRARVIDLWALFPCFCKRPTDLESTLAVLSNTLLRAMGDTRYPELVMIISGGLTSLASGISSALSEVQEGVGDDVQERQNDAEVLSKASTKLLPGLFKLVETLNSSATKTESMEDIETENSKGSTAECAQQIAAISHAIGELARRAPAVFLQSLFKKLMHRLLEATQVDESDRICYLLSLAQGLVVSEALEESSISLLYRALKPLIRSDEYQARVQKRAYKLMAEICKRYKYFVMEGDRLEELLELLLGSIMTSQISSRHMRLKCISIVVEGFDASNKKHTDAIPRIVGEVLLCLKDSNAKTRESAYQVLLSSAMALNEMPKFFQIVAAALGAKTPHMRSAAVMALSRLVFEYGRDHMDVQSLLPPLMQTVLCLFDEDSREVTKSVVGYVRVSVAAMRPEQLEPLLPDLMNGLLKYNKGKDRFRSKIKIILKKLVRLFGYDALIPLVPPGDNRLLVHMRKVDERAARRKAAQREDGGPETRGFESMALDSDEDDSDAGRTLMTGATGFTQMTGRTGRKTRASAISRAESRTAASGKTSRRKDQQAGVQLQNEHKEVLDMLSPDFMAKTKKVVRFDDNVDDSDSEDMEFDASGKLVVREEWEEEQQVEDTAPDAKRQRISKFENAKMNQQERQRKKNQKKGVPELGASYKSKKAGGDVKKKGQRYEPYAYVPLDGKSYTKNNRRKAVEQMATVVRHGSKRKRG